jgi:hypothetical protein
MHHERPQVGHAGSAQGLRAQGLNPGDLML